MVLKKASPQCLAPFLQLEVRIEQNVVFQISPNLGEIYNYLRISSIELFDFF